MSRRALARRIRATTRRYAVSTKRVHVVARLLVHDRRQEIDGTLCYCCGSEHAEVVEEVPIADFVVIGGRRRTRADVSEAQWREMIAGAEEVPVTLRCSAAARDMILDSRFVDKIASGGNRASKTTHGLVWMAVNFLRRGGRYRRYWIIGPTAEKAWELMEKMFRPTPSESGVIPPVLPPALVASSPAAPRATDMVTRMIDGSMFEMKSWDGDPNATRAKSHTIIAGLWDEAAACNYRSWLTALRGRCVEHRGSLWLASTATPTSYLKAEVENAIAFERLPEDDPAKLSGKHPGAAWIHKHYAMDQNPWVSLEYIREKMRTLDPNSPEVQRDFYGLWRANEGLFWEKRFSAERHAPDAIMDEHHLDINKWSDAFLAKCGAAGHVPITGDVRRRICSKPSQNPHYAPAHSFNDTFLLGQDVNFGVMSTVLVSVTAPRGKESDMDEWHVWVMACVNSARSNTHAHSKHLTSYELSRAMLDPPGTTRTLEGCLVIIDPSHMNLVDSHQRRHGQVGNPAEVFFRNGLEVRCPKYNFNETEGTYKRTYLDAVSPFTIITRLMNEDRFHLNKRHCGPLLEAFETQLAHPRDAKPLDARSGSTDRIMGNVDALKYLTYAIFNSEPQATIRW